MPRSRFPLLILILLAVAAGAGATGSAATAAHRHTLPEAFSGVRINTLPDGLRVSHVTMWATRHGASLDTHFAVTVHNPRSTTAHRILMLGTCGFESCRQIHARPVVIRGGQTRTLEFEGELPGDAGDIQGALRKPGVTDVFSDNANMLLTSGAWTGPTAGKHYGLSVAGGASSAIRKAGFRLSTQHGPLATLRLSFDAAPDAAGATLTRCNARCSMTTTLQPDLDRSKTTWSLMPVIPRLGAREVRLGVAEPGGGAPLWSANLPWPTP
jgi:hypothetical protein